MQEKECVLYDRLCIHCHECEMCDLDPDKVCDNCGKCIETGEEYAKIMIDAVLMDNDKD